jgi:uncharacterized membrane protein
MTLTRNMEDWERVASIAAGAAIAAMAVRRSRPGRLVAGASLIARGAAGFCPVNYAIGRERRRDDTRRALGGARGIHLHDSITIDRPVSEVFQYWRNLENLPRFMPHIRRVTPLDRMRSHWVVQGPAGTEVEWDAEINNEIVDELIAWRSLPGADVASAGSVHFTPAGAGRTRLEVTMQYDPPAGKLGASLAWLVGQSPSRQLRADLERLKQALDGGAPEPSPRRRRSRRRAGLGDGLEAGV